jgi:glycosyltransferase involved in cell wall biosynthesis
MPLISVIMPVFNAEKYLSFAIDSILKQTFTDFEFLIFNDGSSDNSRQIIESFNDPRIKFFDSVENLGYVAHLNRGIEIAAGKYIARMDADDISLPERFETQVSFLESHPEVGLCGAWIRQFKNDDDRSGGIVTRFAANHEKISVHLLRHNSFAHPVVMIRRSILIDHGLRYDADFMPSEDGRLWVTMKKYTRLHNIQKVLLYYRIHASQTSTVQKQRRYRNTTRIKIELIEEIVGTLSEKEKSIYADIIHHTYQHTSDYLADLFALVNKIIAANNVKKLYVPALLNRQLQNTLKSVSKRFIKKNGKVLFLWTKLHPQKVSLQYYVYFIYLLFLRLNLRSN